VAAGHLLARLRALPDRWSDGMAAADDVMRGDGAKTHPRYATWNSIAPLPPESLLVSVGGASLELFLVLADAFNQLIATHLVKPGTVVLDVGCGCGGKARGLLHNRFIDRYIGFDVIKENIAWCDKFLKPYFDCDAEFIWYDVYSAEYNKNGRMRATELRFPCEDDSVDLSIAASVFTHLLEADAIHYLNETRRVLKPNGRARYSIHTSVHSGLRYVGTETRIDIEPTYFVELAASAGLEPKEEPFDLGGQDIFTLGRK
jgi:SAM-dependent methyltransferase